MAGASGIRSVPNQICDSICCAKLLVNKGAAENVPLIWYKEASDSFQTFKINFYMVKHVWFDTKLIQNRPRLVDFVSKRDIFLQSQWPS